MIDFFEDLYYNIKWYLWNLRKYHKIVKNMRPWDGSCIYEMVKFQLEILLPVIENGQEVDESRLPKVKKIKRLIELLNNNIEDNYTDRSGFDNNFKFVKMEGTNLTQLESTETPEQIKNNQEAIEKSLELEKKELKEIGKLFSEVTYW